MEQTLMEASVPSALVQNSQAVARLLHHLERGRLPLLALHLLNTRTFSMETAAEGIVLAMCVDGWTTFHALDLHTSQQRLGKSRVATNYTRIHNLISDRSGSILLSV